MIVFNPGPPPSFNQVDGDRSFHPITYVIEGWYAKFISLNPLNRSPQDLAYCANNGAGMQLCHEVSFAEIELMVCDYLNGVISVNQFMILTGSVMRPSWTNLMFPPGVLMLILQWGMTVIDRAAIFGTQAIGQGALAAAVANNLVSVLNNAYPNLRYGHASTNMSIGRRLDLRLHRGLTIDPLILFQMLMGNGPIYAAESTAILNDWEARVNVSMAPPVAALGLPGGTKATESATQIGRTQTAAHNPLVGFANPPRRQYLRGSARVWLPVSSDTALLIIGCLLVYFYIWPQLFGGEL